MNAIGKAMLALAVSSTMLVGAGVPGLPDRFTFSVNAFRKGTAWKVPAQEARMYRDRNGKPMCEFFGDMSFPAYYDERVEAYYCPGVTVRHLHDVSISRSNGKCHGFICEYDIARPGGGPQLTTDLVEYCPDVILTVRRGNTMEVVAAKTFKKGENASRYFENGKHIDIWMDTEEILVDKCGGQRYRDQVEYWLGSVVNRKAVVVTKNVDDPSWDGF